MGCSHCGGVTYTPIVWDSPTPTVELVLVKFTGNAITRPQFGEVTGVLYDFRDHPQQYVDRRDRLGLIGVIDVEEP